MNDQFDALDLRLLDALQTDASLSNQDLAARVAVSPATCLRRVKRLVDLGVIERRVALLCFEANPAGCHRAVLAERLANEDGARIVNL